MRSLTDLKYFSKCWDTYCIEQMCCMTKEFLDIYKMPILLNYTTSYCQLIYKAMHRFVARSKCH